MKYIIANWKSNKSRGEVENWMESFANVKVQMSNVKTIICPPMSFLFTISDKLSDERYQGVELGVQDISPYPAGKYTGAVSARNLDGFGVKYAIVGHSERRKFFHETHQEIAAKVAQCVENGIMPIVCIDDDYLLDQAKAIETKYLEKCMVAYEEPSAIGTGQNEPLDHVIDVVSRIKKVFGDVRVLYGGSADASNAGQYLEATDGLLVGTASLEVDDFVDILVVTDSQK